MSDLTLIIPAKNEKESLPKVLDELEGFNFKKNVILEKWALFFYKENILSQRGTVGNLHHSSKENPDIFWPFSEF